VIRAGQTLLRMAMLLCVAGVFLGMASGAGARTFSPPFGAGVLSSPHGVAVDEAGNIYVADTGNSRVRVFDKTRALIGTFGTTGTGSGQMQQPTGVAVSSAAAGGGSPHIFYADPGNKTVQELDGAGKYVRGFGSFSDPVGVEVDAAGHVLVTDAALDIVVRFSPNGTLLNVWGRPGGGAGSGPGEYSDPLDLASEADGSLLVADEQNNRLQKLTAAGTPDAGWTDPTLPLPTGLDTEQETGNVWAVAQGTDDIRQFQPSGAPTGVDPVSGAHDPGTHLAGEFSNPYGLAVDCAGNVFVADTGNNRMQVFDNGAVPPCGPPSNTRSPELTGSSTVGSVLTLDRGDWVGPPPPVLHFRFQRCLNATAVSCGDIPGASGQITGAPDLIPTYVVTNADRGRRLRAVVIATNDKGTVSEATDMTPFIPVLPVPPLPPEPPIPGPDPITPFPGPPAPHPPTVTQTGFGTFSVGCPRAGPLTCEVSATLDGLARVPGKKRKKGRKKIVTFAGTEGEVPFDQTGTFQLILTRVAKQLLKKGYRGQPVMQVYVNGALLLSSPLQLNRQTARQIGGLGR
jgi:streptogramin lyase